MTPRTFRALPARLARVGDLGTRDGTDVDALGVRLVRLEAARALAVLRAVATGRVDAVACVGADHHRLPQDVVAGLAVRAQAEGVRAVGERGGGGGAEEGRLLRGRVRS